MAETTAKERVERELDELNEKIVKLSGFLYGGTILTANISREMTFLMQDQLRAMETYAQALQNRLRIWGKTDAEIDKERNGPKIGF